MAVGAPLHAYELLASVRAGFPSPAEDLGAKRIDLTARLIKHPQATFLLKARGDSMREAGICDGDVLVVDKAVRERSGHVVIAVVDGEFDEEDSLVIALSEALDPDHKNELGG